MRRPNHQQTFQSGIAQDVDPHLQPANTYRDADNIQLLYNPDDSDAVMGHGLAVSPARGNRLALTLPPGYALIGSADCTRGTLLFSGDGTSSEIGLWSWDQGDGTQPGSYQTLYNDAFEPNLKNEPFVRRTAGQAGGDRFSWPVDGSMDIRVVYETVLTERVYWTDRASAVHCLDLNDAFMQSEPSSPGLTWHQVTAGAGGVYPKHWSMHAFRERGDLVFPRLKFAGRGRGRLLSGVYQVALQYRHKNGHESVFSPLSRRVFVSTAPLDDANAAKQTARRLNHHHRTMPQSGQMTGESLRFELEGLDTRWAEVRVAVVYYQSPDKPHKRVLMKPIPLTDQTTLTVDITQLEGDELGDAAFSQVYDTCLRAGTLEVVDNMLITGNLTFGPAVGFDATGVRFKPTLRGLVADETDMPTFQGKPNAVTGRSDNDPLTNSSVVGERELTLSAFTGQTVRYTLRNDYAHYKGQLYDQLLKGYFRGETYEFGVVVLDRAGQPLFVQPLPAYTFPEQYSPGPAGQVNHYSLTRKGAGGRYELQAMGLTLTGLALPARDLYDQHGRLNVSGFMVVRRKRAPRLKHQGVAFPAVSPDRVPHTNNKARIWPLPNLENSFETNFIEGNAHGYFVPQLGPFNSSPGKGANIRTMPHFLHLHSPDVLIEEGLDEPRPGDQLKYVGQVHADTTANVRELAGSNEHFYSKNYRTTTSAYEPALTAKGRPALGETSTIELLKVHSLGFDQTYKEFDKNRLKLEWETQAHPALNDGGRLYTMDSLQQRLSVLVKTPDWQSVDLTDSRIEPRPEGDRYSSYRLVNYLQTTPPTGEREPYFSTGHFQPLTQSVLEQAAERFDAAGRLTHYVFDEVEVWGGDCYVNLFDFTRLYPFWSDNCEKKAGNKYHDYAVSHIVPIESKYNLALRVGRSVAASATYPQHTGCENANNQFTNGIMAQQPEDWDCNAVLLLEEGLQFYNAKDPEVELVTELPDGFQWTPEKDAGQLVDSWRLRYVANRGRADGALGPITKLVRGSFQNLYVFQTRGFGAAPLNASRYQTDEAGLVVINTGRVFNGMVQLSRELGTQHPESVWVSRGQLGAWDARNGVLLRHSQAGLDELSKSENLHDSVERLTADLGAADGQTLKTWNAVSGVDANEDVRTTFFAGGIPQKTLVFSPRIGAFVGSSPGHARRTGNRGRYLFSVSPAGLDKLWLHHNARRGEWFGVVYDSRIRFIVNPAPTVTKRFDNGFVNVNRSGVGAVASLRHWTPNGGVEQQHVVSGNDERMAFRDNLLVYPMHEEDWADAKRPLRDHYCVVELTLDNDLDLPVEIISFGTSFLTV